MKKFGAFIFYFFIICLIFASFLPLIMYLIEDKSFILPYIIIISFFLLPIFFSIVLVNKIKSKDYIFEEKLNTNNITYYRDIPLNCNVFEIYALLIRYDIIKRGQNLIGAIFLSWYQKGYINIKKSTKSFANINLDYFAIEFKDNLSFDNEIEQKLLKILLSASGADGILDENELIDYCDNNPLDLDLWFWEARLYGEQLLIEDGLILENTANPNKGKYIITKQANNTILEILGLREYLLNYSMISEKEAIETVIWENYLIIAQLLGISDKVKEQFKDLNLNFGAYTDLNISFSSLSKSMVSLLDSLKTSK